MRLDPPGTRTVSLSSTSWGVARRAFARASCTAPFRVWRRTSWRASSRYGISAKCAMLRRYARARSEMAAKHCRSPAPASRPARTKLVARRFRSHSHGPRVVSSKSFTSKTRCPSGAAKAPRLRTWASPQIYTASGVLGRPARSAAITGAAPRKNPNGDSAMRPCLIGSSSTTRPSRRAAGSRRDPRALGWPAIARGPRARSDRAGRARERAAPRSSPRCAEVRVVASAWTT